MAPTTHCGRRCRSARAKCDGGGIFKWQLIKFAPQPTADCGRAARSDGVFAPSAARTLCALAPIVRRAAPKIYYIISFLRVRLKQTVRSQPGVRTRSHTLTQYLCELQCTTTPTIYSRTLSTRRVAKEIPTAHSRRKPRGNTTQQQQRNTFVHAHNLHVCTYEMCETGCCAHVRSVLYA